MKIVRWDNDSRSFQETEFQSLKRKLRKFYNSSELVRVQIYFDEACHCDEWENNAKYECLLET